MKEGSREIWKENESKIDEYRKDLELGGNEIRISIFSYIKLDIIIKIVYIFEYIIYLIFIGKLSLDFVWWKIFFSDW